MECENRSKVYEDDHKVGYACYYPQMGGYVGKAIALFDKGWFEDDYGRQGGCIDVYVWHDGEFPFSDGASPVVLHHCDPSQFVGFGKWLSETNETLKELRHA